MKKILGLILVIGIFTLVLSTSDASAQRGKGKCNGKQTCSAKIDANGDGKCDSITNTNKCNQVGKCNGKSKMNCGKSESSNLNNKCSNMIDANGDGKCDNASGKRRCDSMVTCKAKKVTDDNKTNFSLNQNTPNPVSSSTNISFNIKEASLVKVILSDHLGNYIKDLYEANLNIGDHEFKIDVSNLNPGNYFYSILIGGKMQTKQLIIVK